MCCPPSSVQLEAVSRYHGAKEKTIPKNILQPALVSFQKKFFFLPSFLPSFLSLFLPSYLASFLFSSFSFSSLGSQVRYMDVPRLGVKSKLLLQAYTTATATRDPSRVFELHPSLQQCQILTPLSKARDQDLSPHGY